MSDQPRRIVVSRILLGLAALLFFVGATGIIERTDLNLLAFGLFFLALGMLV